jgi:hypothetical protein
MRVLGILLLIALVANVLIKNRERFLQPLRPFNKRWLNPQILKIAGRPKEPYAALKHVGRVSRKAYITPVQAYPTQDGFVIPLPYGTQTDWCRNVLKAEQCLLAYQGKQYQMEQPELIDDIDAFPLLPPDWRWIFRCMGHKNFLQLTTSVMLSVPEPTPVSA